MIFNMTPQPTIARPTAFRDHVPLARQLATRLSRARLEALFRQVRTFLMVGALGFAVDLSITLALTQALGVSPLLAKPTGVGCAFLLTFLMNRRFTFAARGGRPLHDLCKYFVSCITAQSLNYGVYCCALLIAPSVGLASSGAHAIIGASVLGAGIAANVTFFMARNYAFASAQSQTSPGLR